MDRESNCKILIRTDGTRFCAVHNVPLEPRAAAEEISAQYPCPPNDPQGIHEWYCPGGKQSVLGVA
jgi:hypothetical protein